MNKILKCLFMIAVMAVSLTGCRDDAELANPGTPSNPEKECAGTYSGSWTVDVNGTVDTYNGTLTLTPTDKAYVTTITAVCPETSLDRTSIANVMKNGDTFMFFNEETNNEMGAKFTGTINKDGVASINFEISQRVGKKNNLFKYKFAGSK